MKIHIGIHLLALALTCISSSLFAQDFDYGSELNATDPSKISLPSHDESMIGLGGNLSINRQKGQMTYTIPLPFVDFFGHGYQPKLVYSSSAPHLSTLSLGWSIDLPFIQIHARKGVPRYDEEELSVEGLYSSLDDELGVWDASQGLFRPLVDTSYNLYHYDSDSNRWELKLPNGQTILFGSTDQSRMGEENRIYGWFISEIRDPNQNRMVFHYDKRNNYPLIREIEIISYDQRPFYRLEFLYEERASVIQSFRYGFPITIDKRIKSIILKVVDEDGQETSLQTVNLTYGVLETDQSDRLLNIERRAGNESLPVTELTYRDINIESLSLNPIETTLTLPNTLGNQHPIILDWNGDGVADLLSRESRQQDALYIQNPLSGFSEKVMFPRIAESYQSQQVKLGDIDGDQKTDLIVSPTYSRLRYPGGYYRKITSDGWSEPISLNLPTGAVFRNHLILDINRDGRVDLFNINQGFSLTYYFSTSEGQFSEERLRFIRSNFPMFFSLSNRQDIIVSDINGDSLSDLAYVVFPRHHRKVCFALNKGYRFEGEQRCKPVTLPDHPYAEVTWQGLNHRTKKPFILTDISGDGKADLVGFSGRKLIVLYQLSDGFGNGLVLDLRDSLQNMRYSDVLFFDANGNGTQDLVLVIHTRNHSHIYKYIDFAEDRSSGLVVHIDDGKGLQTRFTYSSSSKSCLDMRCHLDNRDVFTILEKKETFHWNQQHSEVQYNYANGFFDQSLNLFQGFEVVEEVINENNRKILETYQYDVGRESRFLAGLLLKHETSEQVQGEAIKKLREVSNTYSLITTPFGSVRYLQRARKISFGITDRQSITEAVSNLELHDQLFTPLSYERSLHGDGQRRTSYREFTVPGYDRWIIRGSLDKQNNIPSNRYEWDLETGKLKKIWKWMEFVSDEAIANADERGWCSVRNFPTQTQWVQLGEFTYDSLSGVPTSYSDLLGRTVELLYESQGRGFLPTTVHTLVNGENVSTQLYQYSLQHGLKLTQIEDERGAIQRFTYDPFWRLSQVFERDNQETPHKQYHYIYVDDVDAKYHRTQVTYSDRTYPDIYLYDVEGRHVSSVTQLGNERYRFTNAKVFDSRGHVSLSFLPFGYESLVGWEDDPDLNTTKQDYDALGRQVSREQANGGVWAFQYDADTVEVTTPRSHLRHKLQNAFGEVTGWEIPLESQTYTTEASYDLWGRIHQINVGGYRRSYQYAVQGALKRVEAPFFGSTDFYANQDNSMTFQAVKDSDDRLAGWHINQTDDLGRVFHDRKIDCQNGMKQNHITYIYGTSGDQKHLLSEKQYESDYGPSWKERFRYDVRARLIEKTIELGEHNFVTRFAYNGLNNLIQKHYPTGDSITYEYENGLDLQRIRLGDQVIQLTHRNDGLLTQIQLGDYVITHSYDPQTLELISKQSTDQFIRYNYDVSQNVTGYQTNSERQGFQYDALDRIESQNSQEYKYSVSGDLLKGPESWFRLVSNFVQSLFWTVPEEANVHPFNVNSLGQITQFGIAQQTTLTYDFLSRVRSAQLANGKQVFYDYADSHYPVYRSSIVNGHVESSGWYFNDLGYYDALAQRWSIEGALASGDVVYRIVQTDGGTKLALAFTDKNGTIQSFHGDGYDQQRAYNIWGKKLTPDNDTMQLRRGYALQHEDSETGLSFTLNRVYIPTLKRFASVDPLLRRNPIKLINSPVEWNPFQYAANNPLRLIDPNGLWTVQMGYSVTGGVGAGGTGGAGLVFGYSKESGFQFGTYGLAGVGGVAGIGGSLTLDISYSSNSNINQLSGTTGTVGGSFGELFVMGSEVNISSNGAKPSYTLSMGVGIGMPIGEMHGFAVNTSINSWQGTLELAANGSLNQVNNTNSFGFQNGSNTISFTDGGWGSRGNALGGSMGYGLGVDIGFDSDMGSSLDFDSSFSEAMSVDFDFDTSFDSVDFSNF